MPYCPPVVRTLRLAWLRGPFPRTRPTRRTCVRAEICSLLREAHQAGARLVQFPEGATTYPGKYVMSSAGPDNLAASDWTRLPWDLLRQEAEVIADLAADLGLWVAFGTPHPVTAPNRPQHHPTRATNTEHGRSHPYGSSVTEAGAVC